MEQQLRNYFKKFQRLKTFFKLVLASQSTEDVKTRREELKKQYTDASDKLTEMKDDHFAIATELSRQYKLMQDELLSKVNKLEHEVADLEEQLGTRQFNS